MYCANCGSEVTAGQKFCAKCGTANAAEPPPALGQSKPAAQTTISPVGTASPVPYAGFWRRFLGWLIDYLITVLIAVVAVVLFRTSTGQQTAGVLSFLGYVILPLLYYAGMESSKLQATVGKLGVGIKVTDLAGNRISFGRAVGRWFAHVLDGLTLGVGYGAAAFTQRRQALHDMAAGTLVVKKEYDAESIRTAGTAPTSGSRTALVIIAMLLFGPFSIGVVAAIAIPAYQDYTIRAQITEGLNAASAYEAAIAEAAAQGTKFADINSKSLKIEPANLRYVQSVEVEVGAIEILYGRDAHSNIRGKRVLLVPALDDQQTITWVCGHAQIPRGSSATVQDAAKWTTVPDKYLPQACRSR